MPPVQSQFRIALFPQLLGLRRYRAQMVPLNLSSIRAEQLQRAHLHHHTCAGIKPAEFRRWTVRQIQNAPVPLHFCAQMALANPRFGIAVRHQVAQKLLPYGAPIPNRIVKQQLIRVKI
mmetsp:Transcript_12115/g.18065  ORF Transcript_12115/g.18065 Transcript_12115/m.18065 type:complete len:119 (+) Transcript_12115:8680-9036(+)